MITSFKDDYEFLSNFYPCKITIAKNITGYGFKGLGSKFDSNSTKAAMLFQS